MRRQAKCHGRLLRKKQSRTLEFQVMVDRIGGEGIGKQLAEFNLTGFEDEGWFWIATGSLRRMTYETPQALGRPSMWHRRQRRSC